ncbi:MAG: DUF2834 domain-containing protein [Pseudomonadales bacterium]|nr:DUF2834 domain-containing protein [Pseudomonadales bacterium]
MKMFFLACTILGTVIPYAFFLDYFADEGIVITSFVGALFANGAAGGFTADLLVSSFVFWGYLFWRQADRIWLFILLNLTIGLSCALPLYFYFQAAFEETRELPSR